MRFSSRTVVPRSAPGRRRNVIPVSRSNLFAFGVGLAAGAAAYATYPRWKGRVAPLVSAAVAGATAAMHDVQEAVREKGRAGEPAHAAEAARTAPGRNGSGAVAPTVI